MNILFTLSTDTYQKFAFPKLRWKGGVQNGIMMMGIVNLSQVVQDGGECRRANRGALILLG